MAVVTEERKLHTQVEITCQKSEDQAQATTPITLPTQARTPKVGVLDNFGRTRGMKAGVYASQQANGPTC
ncbi:hypothetical protein VP01_2893g2 [Puccinia sorghi]|uniref:Uncharacterized protein n=1 Tax=Puccinia sorghi TaxID=27349 RepID=A0A0L6V2A5_9BASI|nr:hypothetical protein VP01_2893g2 [Puccinia sorghi]